MKLGIYIMAPESISTTYSINPSHQSGVCVCVCVYSSIVARQRHVEHVPAATNTKNKELLGASFSERSMSYQRRVCGSVYPHAVARQWLEKHILAATIVGASFSMRSVLYLRRVRVCLCILLSLQGNGLRNTFSRQQIVGGVVFYAVHVITKESKGFVLPTNSSFSCEIIFRFAHFHSTQML
jgi:hypothetical protein